MPVIALNLVVLRSAVIERAVEFYSRLGLHFTRHRHGHGPEHLAAEIAGAVFELYPLAPNAPSTLGTRVGFKVSSIDEVLTGLTDHPDAVVTAPQNSQWGRRVVLVDPDGHRVELIQG